MADLFENPIGLDGFEFVEFSAPEKGQLEPVFEAMGFSLVARHRSKDVQLWRQGGINLIANYEPKSPAAFSQLNMARLPAVWGSAFVMRKQLTKKPWSAVRNPQKRGPAQWNCTSLRFAGSAIH